MTTYTTPFYYFKNGKKEIAGLVAIDIALSELKHIINAIELGRNGFGYITSKKGTFIYHPITEWVKEQKNVFTLAKEYKSKDLEQIAKKWLKGESGILDFKNVELGLNSWLAFEPITATGWELATIFIKDEIEINEIINRKYKIKIIIALMVFLIITIFLLFFVFEKNNSYWKLALGNSLIFIIGIAIIWNVALTSSSYKEKKSLTVMNKNSLNKFKEKYTAKSKLNHIENPVYIPTGIFIQSLQFTGTYNIVVKGYIWQKYLTSQLKNITPGFILPEAESITIDKSYENKQHNKYVLGWNFTATLRQRFNYSKFPLNVESVWIRLWHKDFSGNVVLVPDLESYKFTTAKAKPGLEYDFILPGWSLDKTFFEYRFNSYNTNFGIDNYIGQEDFPELYYNIIIKSNFIDAFVANLMPLILVAFLLFGVLMTTGKDDNNHKTGSETSKVLGSCAALFFVIVVAHTGLRGRISYNDIIYLEYFYILMYLSLLWISINSLLSMILNKRWFFSFNENYFAKLFYWPVLLGIIFLITIKVFY